MAPRSCGSSSGMHSLVDVATPFHQAVFAFTAAGGSSVQDKLIRVVYTRYSGDLSCEYYTRQLGHDFVFKCWRAFSKYTPLIPPLPLAAGKMRAWTKHCGLVQICCLVTQRKCLGRCLQRHALVSNCTALFQTSMDSTRTAFSLMNEIQFSIA